MPLIINETERAHWRYDPLVSVGPLRFGMSHEQASEAMEVEGFICDAIQTGLGHGRLDRRAEFRRPEALGGAAPVITYFLDEDTLAVVAVDGLCGPQVRLGELRLAGQLPSELTERVWDYVTERGMDRTLSVEGEVSSEHLGFLVRAQEAGEVRLSRPIFVNCNGWAHTVHDCIPVPEWNVR
ncbi:hypothetical protein ABH940_000119 [Streptacidiphilus sp. BW17]|uniref:hypothetical protein n=1 Tax=Streptacidiphilus sp. BW17 TaxID=3156274 RepID=UPI0035158020